MPVVQPGSKILVSGANGFIAIWVVRTLLEQGYAVRGAVRSTEKGKHLKKYFESYGDKVEWVVVEDITKDGAFDEAVKDVDAIEHMASPVSTPSDDPDDYIKPAVHGTVGILQSALKAGTNVKRIVLTSSVAAIVSSVTTPPQTVDESNWGDEYVRTVKELGNKSPWVVKYRASKTLAERSAWEFYNSHKAEISWDLVALNPPFVLGPPLQEVDSPAHLNLSVASFFNMVFKEQPDEALQNSYGYIHVKDIAAAHVLALSNEAAAGERMIISSGQITYQETRSSCFRFGTRKFPADYMIGNLIYSLYPNYYTSGVLPRGTPDLDKTLTYIYKNDKGKKILELEYKNLTEIVADILADFKSRGWLEKRYEG
ncbi:D-lactaldehyde dehydrogenase [Flammula alnicola]|nr:D-lactaldehyde dehydrogenase [Flammula alnicola]